MEVTAMLPFTKSPSRWRLCLLGVFCAIAEQAHAQNTIISRVQHLSFDSPEAWALKYFTSLSLLSGLPPPDAIVEQRRTGSIILGLETGWMPSLTPEQSRVGFSGRKQEELNKAPILMRPSIRVGLPWRLSLVASAPLPVRVFGITPRLFAFGVERPIVERRLWRIGWRASGQVGSVKGAFTCPNRALGFPAGSANNPSGCIAESADVASLRYAGTEVQFAQQIPRMPRLTPHVAAGVNYIDSAFHVNARLENALDRTRLWTHGKTYSFTGGVTYLLTNRMALTIDAFYSPLGVRRDPAGPRMNDGLFNVRALLSYGLR
jgi:hypothetical protein